MAKYAALETFLLSQNKAVIQTTFAEIEKVVGQPLPASAKYPAWWSNNPSNNSMTKVWRRAGFRTEQVDVARKTIVFRRPMSDEEQIRQQKALNAFRAGSRERLQTRPQSDTPKEIGLGEPKRTFSTSRHPLRGALKGVLRLVGGTDLSKPADPEWGGR